MRHVIPYANWTMALADTIEYAMDGDEILCHSEAMREMGLSAASRMCPGKKITFITDDVNEKEMD